MSVEVGNVVEGTVQGITKFGAFVTLPSGDTGLIHISEVAESYVNDVKDYLKENDKVKVKVISIKDGKIGLSIRRVNEKPGGRSSSRTQGHSRGRGPVSFEDRLTRFMKESDERQTDIRRHRDAKRGGGGARK